MTEHEFFKLLSDIDEGMVVDAKAPADLHNDPFSELPQKIKPVRRSVWKPLAAAAACLTVVAVVLAVVFNIRGRHIDSVQPALSAKEGYPSGAVYQYKGDFSELTLQTLPEDYRFRNDAYREIDRSLSDCDLVVVGTFVDDAYQNVPLTEDGQTNLPQGCSYNKLRIDEVYKGDAKVGEEIIICDNYYVYEGVLINEDRYALRTPMIKGEQWVYLLDRSDPYYVPHRLDTARYPVPGNENSFVLSENTCGVYYMYQFSYDNYEYVKRMLNKDPEVLRLMRIEYDGLIYNVADYGDYDGVRFIIGSTRKTYVPGDYVEVLAAVENNTDKPVGLLMPVIGEDSYTQVNFQLNNYGKYYYYFIGEHKIADQVGQGQSLSEVRDGDKEFASYPDALSSHIIQPGETYYQAMRFSTYEQRYKAEDTVIADHVSSGEYRGTAAIRLLSDPNDTTSAATEYVLSGLSVYIMHQIGSYNFTMDEFPGVKFRCDGENLTARVNNTDTMLFSESSIGDLYLIDLNGDGKRELCSNVYGRSGDTADKRILAFDYANGKLYALADMGNYDYRIKVGRSVGGWYADAAKYDFASHSFVSSEPLSLNIMTEVKGITTETDQRIETAKLAGSNLECDYCEFSMAEFPGAEFYCKYNKLYANGESLDPVERNYDTLYIADLNGDGKREILAECRGNDGHTGVFIYDHANRSSYSMGLDDDDAYSLYWDGGADIFIVINGERSLEPLRIISSAKAEVVRGKNTRHESFTMPEFPGTEFAIEGGSVTARFQNGEARTLFTFPEGITKLYLQDLNGDGRREIAAEGWGQAGQRSETFIRAYDIAVSKLYELTAAKRYYSSGSCSLNIGGDGKLCVELRTVLSEQLTLDIMSQVLEDYDPQVEVILDESVHKDSFTMPEYPEYKFIVENGGITTFNTFYGKYGYGGVNGKRLFGTAVAERIYLFDTNGNNKREIVAVVKRSGEDYPVVCTVHMDRLEYFTSEFKEPYVEIVIKDGKLIYTDSIEWILEHSFNN